METEPQIILHRELIDLSNYLYLAINSFDKHFVIYYLSV
jgi:hypothetical protein